MMESNMYDPADDDDAQDPDNDISVADCLSLMFGDLDDTNDDNNSNE